MLSGTLHVGARVADIGAGQGALAQRLKDAGFRIVAFELECAGWMAPEIDCLEADVEGSLSKVLAAGPFDAFCVIDVIEHLENPRGFLRELIGAAGEHGGRVVLSMPNPLDTFSSITLFTRGVFNWFSRNHYFGGGHISIVPFWMLDEHLRFLGIDKTDWYFLYPYVHPDRFRQMMYRTVGAFRRLLSRSTDTRYFEGQTAVVVFDVVQRPRLGA